MKTLYTLLPLAIIGILISATNPPKPPKELKTVSKELGEGFVYVPAGSTSIDGRTVPVIAFFMNRGEVTNAEYRAFLSYLKTNNETEKLKIAMIDSARWSYNQNYGNPYEKMYGWHPAYSNYPVVNISYEAAQLYCEYLTKAYNEKAAKSHSGITYNFRIPERAEFLRAAKGDDPNRVYAWDGHYMRNGMGLIQCNHTQIGNEDVHYNSETKQYEIIIDSKQSETDQAQNYHADITAPSISFWPNQFGIYNLNGNVSEMISEKGKAVGGDWMSPGYDVRNESIKTVEGPAPTTGFRVVMSVQ